MLVSLSEKYSSHIILFSTGYILFIYTSHLLEYMISLFTAQPALS